MKPSAIQFFSTAGLFSSILLIPNLARDLFGASTIEIGFVVSFYSLALFLSSYIFGRASDVHGRRMILRVGLILASISLLLQILAVDTVTLILARVLVGFCAGMFPSALMAYVFDTKGRIGRFSAFGSLGFGFGVMVAGIIGDFDLIFMVSAAFMAIAFFISLFIPFGNEKQQKVPLFPVEIMKRNFPAYGAVLLRHTGTNMVWVTFPIFLEDLGAAPIFIGVIYATNAITQFTAMQLVERFNPLYLVATGLVLSSVTFVLFTQANVYWEILPLEFILATAWACLYIGSINYIMSQGPERGTSAGLLQSSISIAAIIGSMIGGAITFAFGYHGSMLVAAGMAIISLLLFAFGHRWVSRRFGNDYISSGS
jgi:DHA1 family quinolone resistance protein-like MFS transporter